MTRRHSQTDDLRQEILEGLAFLSRIFWGPDLETCNKMVEGNCLHPFETLSSRITFDPPGIIEEIGALLAEHADSNSLFQILEESYVNLFISSRGGIPAPLYQSCYTNTERPGKTGLLMGTPAIDMKRRLESVGLSLDGKLGQMPDHLSIEIEYLYFLLQEMGIKENIRLAAEAQTFASEVMLPWVRKFGKRLEDEKENPFYPHMASLLISMLHLISSMSQDRTDVKYFAPS